MIKNVQDRAATKLGIDTLIANILVMF